MSARAPPNSSPGRNYILIRTNHVRGVALYFDSTLAQTARSASMYVDVVGGERNSTPEGQSASAIRKCVCMRTCVGGCERDAHGAYCVYVLIIAKI
jgi:hypothetical protein